jgi:hypothetical protein
MLGLVLVGAAYIAGCSDPPPPQWGVEHGPLMLPGHKRQVWAVAPMVNLSGQKAADSILQADLLYQQLGQVEGVTAIPVNRTVEVLASLRLEKVQSERQAALVCELLGCDGLIVPTITIYDPYNPPKLGAALQLFLKPPGMARPASVSPREMARQASPPVDQSLPRGSEIVQVVKMCDAQNGSVRDAMLRYAEGRHDPLGPLGAREYLVCMDRFCGFVYHGMLADLLNSPKLKHAEEKGGTGVPPVHSLEAHGPDAHATHD